MQHLLRCLKHIGNSSFALEISAEKLQYLITFHFAGHTTLTCPHRIASEHGVAAAPCRRSLGLLDYVHERQIRNHLPLVQIFLFVFLLLKFSLGNCFKEI